MKICFLAGANSIHSIRWIDFFEKQGHSIVWISLAPPIDQAKELISRVTFYEISPSPLIDENGRKALFYIPQAALKVKRIIERECPDIMQVHSVGTYGLIAALSQFKNIIMTPWGSDILLASPINKLLIKRILKTSKHFTCDGQNTFDALIDYGITTEKISIVRFGTNTELFKQTEEKKEKNYCTVISLRSFEPVYNISHLIRACAIVLKKLPNTKFILAGSGSQHDELIALTKSLKISQAVTFAGRIDACELPKLLNSSDIYVSTSLSDSGLAASTAEAMACELPVIATSTGDNNKWIIPNKGGYLVTPNDDEALANSIIELAKNRHERESFGAYNRSLILEKNDYKTEMEKIEKIYFTHCKSTKL